MSRPVRTARLPRRALSTLRCAGLVALLLSDVSLAARAAQTGVAKTAAPPGGSVKYEDSGEIVLDRAKLLAPPPKQTEPEMPEAPAKGSALRVNPLVGELLEPERPAAPDPEGRRVGLDLGARLREERGRIVAILFAVAVLAPGAAFFLREGRYADYACSAAGACFRASRLLAFLSAAVTVIGWLGWKYNLYAELGGSYVAALVAALGASAFSLKTCDPRATLRRELVTSAAWLAASWAVVLVA